MSVRGVEHKHIHAGGDERGGPGFSFGADADGGADAQTALGVLAGVGILLDLVDVLHGQKPGKLTFLINHEQFFNAVGVQMMLGFLERGSRGHRHQILAGHHVPDESSRQILHKPDIAVSQNTGQLLVPDDGQTRNPVGMHEIQRMLHGVVRVHGNRIEDHPAFRLFDLLDFQLLLFDAHVLMNDAYPAGASHGNGHGRFRHGIHGGGQQRYVQRNGRRQPGRHIDHVGRNFRIGGHQQHIVEGQTLAQDFGHRVLLGDIRFPGAPRAPKDHCC